MDFPPAVGGKYAHQHVPTNLRRIIAAESASNDGLAYPFLSISIYLTVEATKREAFGKWFLVGWLCRFFSFLDAPFRTNHPLFIDQVILGTLFGTVMGKHSNARPYLGLPGSESSVGYGFRKVLNFSHDRGLADRESFMVQYLALALFTIGVASSLGMDDLLAAFAAGTRKPRLSITRIDLNGFSRHSGIVGW